MKYQLTMLHGVQELKEFGDRFAINVRALNRLAYVVDHTEQILFYVDAIEEVSETARKLLNKKDIAPDFELVVTIRQRGQRMEEYTKRAASFLSAVGELDRVYRRFLTATETIEMPTEDIPVAVFNTLRGLLVGMGIPKITE